MSVSRRDVLCAAGALLPLAVARGRVIRAAAPFRALRADDLPAAASRRLATLGVTDVEAWSASLRRDTARRVDEGRWDHLVAVALQSARFTDRARIEPAVSARAYVSGRAIPEDAEARLQACAGALARRDRRLSLVHPLIPASLSREPLLERLRDAYARSMRLLYDKEFGAQDPAALALVYQQRGLSTDTAVEAGYALSEGLGVVRSARTGRLRRVLLVGPGLEMGPRTGLSDDTLGQCYQPFALVDRLRALDLTDAALTVDVLDVNPIVVHELSARVAQPATSRLVLETALSDRAQPLAPDYLQYIRRWGEHLGVTGPTARRLDSGQWRREIQLPADAWRPLSVMQGDVALDVATEAHYDLIVATNVLTYLGDAALITALCAMRLALRPDGTLLHNESRDLVSVAGADAALPVSQVRTVTFTQPAGAAPAVYDRVWIHRAAPQV